MAETPSTPTMTAGKLGIAIEDRYNTITKRELRDKAMSGDIVLAISPATATPAPTASAWTQSVTLTLKTSAGETHEWYSATQASKASASDTSTAGTASVSSGNVVFTNGVATVSLNGDAAAWLATETATLTIANLTILGYTVTGKTCVLTFTAA